MNKKLWTLLSIYIVISMIFLTFPNVKGNVSVEPAKLTIEINEYPEENIHSSIRVTNPYSYNVETSASIISPWGLTKGYIRIPDLSWIDVMPKNLEVPADSSAEFEITISVPDEEKSLHYNENWEVWVKVSPNMNTEKKNDGGSGVRFKTQYLIKILISTPDEEKKLQSPQSLYIFLAGLIGFVMLAAIYFYIKVKRNIKSDRAAIFYVKKRK